MNPAVKWIGGATLGVLLVFGSAVAANQALEAMAPSPAGRSAGEPLAKLKPASLAATKPVAAPKQQPFTIKRILPIDGPIKYGQWFWDDAGVPQGPLVITVDLDARVLSVFRDGYEIGATAVLLGTDEYPTPLGTFPITQKDADHSSSSYDAKMPYMLRLTNDGVSIHGAPVAWNHATHGCIGVPTPFARKLFNVVKLGDHVIVTRGKMMQLGDKIVRS